ncbi:MAG: hypothetical protein R3D30_12445 [Hyphomicrobiales bacterium]
MTSIVPELDDIAFEELVEEGRNLIPRYAPEWTDHNLHDPGITLIDLIAFLTDQQVYRIGFVGDSLKTAFTRLLGVEPRGPEAARLLIWPLPEAPLFDLEAGTELETPDLPDARYTLDATIRMVAAGIQQISRVTGSEVKDLGTGLTEGRDPLALLPFAGGGPRALQIDLDRPIRHAGSAGYVSLGVSIGGAPAGDARWQDVGVEQWDKGGFWRPLETVDRTEGLKKSEVILFRPHAGGDLEIERFRIRLDQGFRPCNVTVERLALNVLPATEGWCDASAVIGEGTGLPDQTLDLETDDILKRDELVIETNAGGIETAWQPRDDLSASGPKDAHYRLTGDGIRFGNGLNGMTVPAGAQIRRGEVRRTAGAAGAVAHRLIWRVAGQDVGRNIAPSSAGRDRDRFEDLARRARAAAIGRTGKLRSAEIESMLRAAGFGLLGVRVMPRRRPGLDGTEAPGSRTVLILPVRDPSTPPGPASGALRDAVETALASARLLGERLHVSHPAYREVDVAAALVVEADADPQEIRAAAEEILRQRLWDVARTPDQTVAPWPAGRPVTVGEIEGLMAGIRQVMRVSDCRIGAPGTLARDAIELKDREIALARRIEVRVTRRIEGGEA